MSAPGAWDPPIPFDDRTVPPFPVEVFPDWLGRFIEAEAQATQTPPDLAAMLSLAVLATGAGGKLRVLLKGGHEEPVNLFAIVVLAPGNRKSAVFQHVTRPIEEFESGEAERLGEAIGSALQERRVLDMRLKEAEERAAGANDSERPKMLEDAQRIRRQRDSLVVPAQPRLIVDDCSPEKLSSLLCEQGGRIALLSSEGDVFDMMAGRYSSKGAPNLGVYLRGHAGDPLRVDRQGRGAEFVSRPALTMGVTIQPEVLQGLMARPGFRGRGLLGRLLYSVPRSTLGCRDVEAPPVPSSTRAAYEVAILRILRIPRGTGPGGAPAPQVLRLDPEARQVFLDFERRLEPQLGEYGELEHIADWAAKLAGGVGRICALLHLADLAEHSSPWERPIGHACAARAVRIGEYLIPHALAAFGQMGADPRVDDARYLLGRLHCANQTSFTKRDAYVITRGRFKRVIDLEPALELLEEHRYIRRRADESRGGSGRKPSPTYDVNPSSRAQNPHNAQNRPLAEGCENTEDSVVKAGRARARASAASGPTVHPSNGAAGSIPEALACGQCGGGGDLLLFGSGGAVVCPRCWIWVRPPLGEAPPQGGGAS